MRKAFSIAFIILILMNCMGIYGIFLGLRFQNDSEIISKLDLGDLKGLETIAIKIPLTLPYPIMSDEFERIDGTYEHNGEYFRLVKQKLSNDTLTIVCIKDQNEKKIVSAIQSYVETFSQTPSTNSSKETTTLIKDYLSQSFGLIPGSCGWENKITLFNPIPHGYSVYLEESGQPPDVI